MINVCASLNSSGTSSLMRTLSACIYKNIRATFVQQITYIYIRTYVCVYTVMILPQVHLRKPCYDFYFL